ncbi:hypothetical protein DL98DRAFT_515395 [Cadophora sp. DSE1049]|nr:hypothetical protein DL98DRAFT_515395 [Cadophora sp. DSE1049]
MRRSASSHLPQHQKYDKFWAPSEPYSLYHMLAHDSLARKFVGGTVYHAYLKPTSYQRWHSPVSGKVVKAYFQPGIYSVQPLDVGTSAGETTKVTIASPISSILSASTLNSPSDFPQITLSHAYAAAMAPRAIIIIEADNPRIGHVALVPVGPGCEVTVTPDQHVTKGDELGMFHLPGSSMCIIFSKEVDVVFNLCGVKGEAIQADATPVEVNSGIATVRRKVEKASLEVRQVTVPRSEFGKTGYGGEIFGEDLWLSMCGFLY